MSAEPGATMRRISLSILDTYKIRWNVPTVVRDVVQNFFDAAGSLAAIRIEVDGKRRAVRLEGPVAFDLDLLRYIGATTKQDASLRTAGGFGEGFKMCALVLLRDHGVGLHTGAGGWQLRPTFQPVHGEGGRLLGRELCYDVEPLEPPIAGSFLTITGASPALLRGFRKAAELFHDPQNPKLARPFFTDPERGIALYHCNGRAGEVYYRRQLRGRLSFSKGAALTLAFDDRLAELDGDRDRRTLLQTLPLQRHLCARLPDDALIRLLLHLKPYWTGKNSLIRVALREAVRRRLTVPAHPRWLADAPDRRELAERARRQGYQVALREFARVGMRTVTEVFGVLALPRPATPAEARRIALIGELYHQCTNRPPLRLPLEVVDTIPQPGHGRFGTPAFSAAALAASFAEGVAYGLAFAARTGSYTARDTTGDRITGLLEGALRCIDEVSHWQARWDAAGTGDGPAPPERVLEVKPEIGDLRPILRVSIFAPPGWHLEPLRARIRAAAQRAQVVFHIASIDIVDDQHARLVGVRGVPTVVIDKKPVALRPGSRIGFYLNTWLDADGHPDLWPSEPALEAALQAGWLTTVRTSPFRGRRRRRRWHDDEPWLIRGRARDRRYREKHDPQSVLAEDLVAELAARCKAMSGEEHGHRYYALEGLMRDELADLPLGQWRARMDERLPALLEVAQALVAAMESPATPDIPHGPGPRARKRLRAGRPLASVLEAARAEAEADRALSARYAAACQGLHRDLTYPLSHVSRPIFEQALDDGLEAPVALERALDILDRAAAYARTWQPPPPEHPDLPVSHQAFAADLRQHLGLPEKPKENRRDAAWGAVGQAVEQAWADARAAGLDDVAAARLALEASREAARGLEPDTTTWGLRAAYSSTQLHD